MTHCKDQRWVFQDLGNRKVEVDFGGGYLSSDGGGLLLRELERHSGLLRALADCFVDHRDPRYVEHSVEELLCQRIHGLALGYEDLNDHDQLRLRSASGVAVRQKRSAGSGALLGAR
jgi:DDE family transposase